MHFFGIVIGLLRWAEAIKYDPTMELMPKRHGLTVPGAHIEFRQLRYFVAVAGERHFGRASRLLSIAQPALSRQVQKLEHALGLQLFVRHSKGVRLTAAGQVLLRRSARILDDMDAIVRDMSSEKAAAASTVTICLSPGTGEVIAAPLATRVAEKSPGIRLRFVSATMQARLDRVLERDADLAIVGNMEPRKGIDYIPLFRGALCLIHRPEEARRFAGPIDLKTLAQLPLIVSEAADSGVRMSVEKALSNVGLSPNFVSEVDSMITAKRMVIAGLGLTVCEASMAHAELARGDLSATPIFGLYWSRVLAISSDRRTSEEIQVVLDLLRECFLDLESSMADRG